MNVQEFYSENDLPQNAEQMKRVYVVTGLISAPFLVALAASLVWRAEWLTIFITVIWGAGLLFFWDMKIEPVRAYRKHLKGLMSGLRRSAEGRVVSLSEDGSFKDNVYFDTLIINVDPKMDPEGERLFYVDKCKPRPALTEGDFARVTSNGNFLTSWEKICGFNSDG